MEFFAKIRSMEDSKHFRQKQEYRLTETQKKSLSIALKMLEERLFLFRLLLNNDSYSGVMYRLKVDFSNAQKEQLNAHFDRILKGIEHLKSKFNLSVIQETLNEQILSTTTYLWTVLEDEKSRKLKRYGKVNTRLSKELDPLLQQLIDDLNALNRSVNRASQNSEE
jgi:hypothetical protein